LGNTALAAAVAAAAQRLPEQPKPDCVYSPSLESACLRLLSESSGGAASAIPGHAHVQTQPAETAALAQLPLLMICISLGWRRLVIVLLKQGVPLHPARKMLLALCRSKLLRLLLLLIYPNWSAVWAGVTLLMHSCSIGIRLAESSSPTRTNSMTTTEQLVLCTQL
jgi:hypothetical protein